MADFVHLHLHSEYSLLDGAVKFEQLAPYLKKNGMSAAALTDHGALFGAVGGKMTKLLVAVLMVVLILVRIL